MVAALTVALALAAPALLAHGIAAALGVTWPYFIVGGLSCGFVAILLRGTRHIQVALQEGLPRVLGAPPPEKEE